MLTSRTSFQKGDTVEYRPIGGAADTVSHSSGTITDIVEEDGVSDILLSLLIAASFHARPAFFVYTRVTNQRPPFAIMYQETKYTIRNDNTGKETTYQVRPQNYTYLLTSTARDKIAYP